MEIPAPVGLHGDAAGFVLAGGQSARMGQDKALVSFCGEPLIARALRLLREAGFEACIAGARSTLAAFAPVVEDRDSGLGPLSGICAALRSTPARWAVFVPVDLPLLPAALLVYLLGRAQLAQSAITLASVSGFAQTFPAVVHRAALPALESEWAAERRGCFSAFQAAAASLGQKVAAVPIELLVQAGQIGHPAGLPALRWFLNVNTPAELRRAETLSAHRIA